jgi:MoaA/NifB/PqqE/SkfB family radical SAM enzyme
MREIFYRYGHANNSSSSHSVIYAPNSNVHEVLNGDSFSFSWEDFILKTPEAKKKYLFAQVCTFLNRKVYGQVNFYNVSTLLNGDINVRNIEDQLCREVCKFVSMNLFDGEFNDYVLTQASDSDISEIGVDHQSSWQFPYSFLFSGHNCPDYEFIKDLVGTLAYTEGIIITGGSDEADELAADAIIREEGRTSLINLIKRLNNSSPNAKQFVRRIAGKRAYVLSNVSEGSIGIYSFSDAEELTKLDIPYLVDLKITNYCPYDCEFCYQGSTSSAEAKAFADGGYEYRRRIYDIIETISSAGVMELVLGGGEPTTIKTSILIDIIERARRSRMKCGMTTNNHDVGYWKRFVEQNPINSLPNSVAFSVNSIESAKSFRRAAVAISKAMRNKYRAVRDDMDTPIAMNVYAQVVVGVASRDDFFEILSLLHGKHGLMSEFYQGITFLGFKENERGSRFIKHEYEHEFISQVVGYRNNYGFSYGVDSVLAEKYQSELSSIVPESHLLTKEGKFTCYIDAVEGFAAPSSFCDPAERVSVLRDGRFVLQAFRQAFNTF